jgi:ABC-type uncharacterized transport system auxiliary subunit
MTHHGRMAAIACVALAALASGGCLARRTPAITYYTLSVPPPAAPTIDGTIVMSTVTAEPGYTETRMAWRPSPYRLDYTSFHRWVAAPSIMLASVLEDYLERASTGAPGRRIFVSGTIRRIEAARNDDGRTANLTLYLEADLEGRPLLARSWDEHEPLADGDGAEEAAAALSAALARILREFTTALVATLPAR